MLMSWRTILPGISKSLSFRLIRFWESWLFNCPLNFILYFPTINLIDEHGTKEVPSLDVSSTYVSNLSSIHWGNPKLLVNYLVTLEFPFSYPNLYKPLILTLWSSFTPFRFGESERSLGVRVYLIFSKEERI